MSGSARLLAHAVRRELVPRAPFHFDGTVCKPSYFPGPDTAYRSGVFWQSMRFEGQALGVRLENCGTVDAPAVALTVYSAAPLEDGLFDRAAEEVATRYGLDMDTAPFYDGCAGDPILAPVLARWRGTRPSSYTSLYEYLVISTCLQNATVRRTVQMMNNLFERYGERIAFDGQDLAAYWEPPAVRAAAEDDLRAIKLGYRAKTLKRQAESFVPGGGAPYLDEAALRRLPTPELKKALLSVYGVGPASVWYLLFGQFKRCEAFETVAPWEQKIFSRLLYDRDLVAPRTILEDAEARWGRWKMLAAHLLFEDLFWRHRREPVAWLAELIRL